nr:WXG100 family type VII secretion target [Actinoplanes solisilvae]
MPTVGTSQSGMQFAIQQFGDRATEFTGLLQSVNSNMAQLQSSWTGQASAGFNQAMDNWENSFKKVIDELIRMLDVMGATTKGYTEAEDTALQTAQSFGQALPGI